MLGAKLGPLRASSQLLPHLGRITGLGPLCLPFNHRVRTVSWKTSAATPSRSGSSSSSRGRSNDSRSSSRYEKDSRDSGSQRQQRWGRSDSSSSRGRDRGRDSQSRPGQHRQQQQQQRSWQDAAARDDTDSWDDYGDDDTYDDSYNDSYDDGDYKYPTRPSKASYRDELFGEALYGVAPILAALKAGVRTPHVLLMQEGLSPAQRKDARALQEIQKMMVDKGAALKTVSKHQLNMLAGNRPHQGLILDASPLQWGSLEVFPAAEDLQQQQQGDQEPSAAAAAGDESSAVVRHPIWLALDEVTDPQNLGAMIRSAHCLGVSGILACSRNCAPLSPVVSKASAGAVELMTLHSCRSMPRTLADASSKGWAVVGAAAEASAVPLSQFSVNRPTILVMGNEGYGLRATVKRCCTQLVQIEMAPAAAAGGSREQLVDSLNVSVATGILLHQLMTTARQ